ncbi:MAG: bifunctional riboflavin kinase/FAD synthetase [Pseudomonadota bacterium]
MEIIRGLHNLRAHHRDCVLTIGNFDGVHHGHQMLLSHLTAKSAELKVPSLLMTFEPQPREYFRGASVPARLTRFREKMVLLQRTALDRVLCLPFNEQLAALPAEAVIDDVLRDRLGARYVVVGDDFHFGAGARGNYDMLKAAGDAHGFGVSHMGTLTFEHDRVSSTRIREVLADGDFELAHRLLGHPYFIMGKVVYGRQLGRQLGVPTANIRLQRYRAALEGVYAVTVYRRGDTREYPGIANIGVRPTVEGKEPLLEVHLFDYAGDLYGQLLSVTFRKHLRDERAFDGLPALQAQIEKDMTQARAFCADGELEPGFPAVTA